MLRVNKFAVFILDVSDVVLRGVSNVGEEVFFLWIWVFLDLLVLIVQLFTNCFFFLLQLVFRGPAELDEHLLGLFNRVTAVPDHLNLFLGAVGDTGV